MWWFYVSVHVSHQSWDGWRLFPGRAHHDLVAREFFSLMLTLGIFLFVVHVQHLMASFIPFQTRLGRLCSPVTSVAVTSWGWRARGRPAASRWERLNGTYDPASDPLLQNQSAG